MDNASSVGDASEIFNIVQNGYELKVSEAASIIKTAFEAEKKYIIKERRWKVALIIGTGLVAVINIFTATFQANLLPVGHAAAPIASVILAIMANLDSYLGNDRHARDHGTLARSLNTSLYRLEDQWVLRVESEANAATKIKNARDVLDKFGREMIQILGSFDPHRKPKE